MDSAATTKPPSNKAVTSMDRTLPSMKKPHGTPSTVIEPPLLDFGSVWLGTSPEQIITIFNTCPREVTFRMGSLLLADTGDGKKPTATLKFSPREGRIPPRLSVAVAVVLNAQIRSIDPIEFAAFCELSEGEEPPAKLTDITPQTIAQWPKCKVIAEGSLPCLTITDARSERFGKTHLWEQFSLHELNTLLEEVPLSKAGHQDFSVRKQIGESPSYDMDFFGSPLSTHPTVVQLQFTNSGKVAAEFSFRFPNDLGLPEEPWWTPEPLGDDDLDFERVMDSQLFRIEPKFGKVGPGGTTTVTFRYHHMEPGRHVLPVLFTVKDVHRATLRLCGTTLQLEEPALQFSRGKQHFSLDPVPLGSNPPTQYWELRNPSAQQTSFKIHDGPLDEVRMENHMFPIFSIPQTQGVIPPGESTWVKVIFHPLEDIPYSVDLIVTVENEQYEVTLSGEGYHPDLANPGDHTSPESTAHPVPAPIEMSLDAIRFEADVGSIHRSMVLLHNTSSEVYQVNWNTALPGLPNEAEPNRPMQTFVEATPNTGEILPGESLACRIDVYVGGEPCAINHDIDLVVLTAKDEPHTPPGTPPVFAGSAGSAMRSARGRSITKAVQSLKLRIVASVSASSPALLMDQQPKESLADTCTDFITNILREVVQSEEVGSAFDELHISPVPTFAEMIGQPVLRGPTLVEGSKCQTDAWEQQQEFHSAVLRDDFRFAAESILCNLVFAISCEESGKAWHQMQLRS